MKTEKYLIGMAGAHAALGALHISEIAKSRI